MTQGAFQIVVVSKDETTAKQMSAIDSFKAGEGKRTVVGLGLETGVYDAFCTHVFRYKFQLPIAIQIFNDLEFLSTCCPSANILVVLLQPVTLDELLAAAIIKVATETSTQPVNQKHYAEIQKFLTDLQLYLYMGLAIKQIPGEMALIIRKALLACDKDAHLLKTFVNFFSKCMTGACEEKRLQEFKKAHVAGIASLRQRIQPELYNNGEVVVIRDSEYEAEMLVFDYNDAEAVIFIQAVPGGGNRIAIYFHPRRAEYVELMQDVLKCFSDEVWVKRGYMLRTKKHASYPVKPEEIISALCSVLQVHQSVHVSDDAFVVPSTDDARLVGAVVEFHERKRHERRSSTDVPIPSTRRKY